jgi:hypothetical protein
MFGRLKKWKFQIDGGVLSMHGILDFSNRVRCRVPDSPNMQGNELQVMRIDMTGVDEALGFLRATAGIVRVHQSALAVHELVEIAAGAPEALSEVVGRHLQDFTTDGVARSKDRAGPGARDRPRELSGFHASRCTLFPLSLRRDPPTTNRARRPTPLGAGWSDQSWAASRHHRVRSGRVSGYKWLLRL